MNILNSLFGKKKESRQENNKLAEKSIKEVRKEENSKIAETYTVNIEKLSADIDELARVCKEEKLRSAILKLGHLARESKLESNEKTTDIDTRLCHEIDILASLIRIDYSSALDKINEIAGMIEERKGQL